MQDGGLMLGYEGRAAVIVKTPEKQAFFLTR